jgi:phage-related holin
MAKFFLNLTDGWQVNIFLASVFTYLFGEYNAGMGALLCLMLLDFFSKIAVLAREGGGFFIAWKTDLINSKSMRQSIFKGLGYMALLILSHQLQHFTVLGLELGATPVEVTCAYLGLIEAKSILEHLRDLGLKNLEPLSWILGEKQKTLCKK